jgi:DNA modification methylase
MTSKIELYNCDCLEFMKTLPDKSIDAVITDPPYGIGYCHGSRKGGEKMGTDGMSIIGDGAQFDPSPFLSFDKICLWGANYYADKLPVSSRWLVWDKRNGIPSNDQADCELAWTNQNGVARLMTRYWNGAQAKEKYEDRTHPNQKPVSLMIWCMEVLGIPETATIFDPYAGSATTAIACLRTGRNFIGCEIDPGYFAIAQQRIARAQMQPSLFDEVKP